MNRYGQILAVAGVLLTGLVVRATETENLGIRVLPAPKTVVIDGKVDDWDLSGGIFACGDAETQRDQFAVWFHTMADETNLYLLARWIDETPMNNPGQTIADYGFSGDSLQIRFVTSAKTESERASHWTCWRGTDGPDLMDVHFGLFSGKKSAYSRDLKDARTEGAQQAFLKNSDGKGYAQELSIPWKMLSVDGLPPKAGRTLCMTIEPNFTVGRKGRLTVKDIFRAGVSLDRVFTFQGYGCWGAATFEAQGQVAPQPVRLSDGREFPVTMVPATGSTGSPQAGSGQVPVVDWTGLIKSKELAGFKPITFTMPEDGYLSLNLKSEDGTVVRQLLNAAFITKGVQEVKWDGLTTPNWRLPGEPVPPGKYHWEAIWHKGIGLTLRGWAANSGNSPWSSSPQSNWGGDHGVPCATAVDRSRVYLGWKGGEAGRPLLACDLQGNVKWGNKRAGIAGVKAITADGGVVYVLGGSAGLASSGGFLYKLDATQGSYLSWDGRDDADLEVKALWDGAPIRANGISANGGKLFIAFDVTNTIAVLDAKTGKFEKTLDIKEPLALQAVSDTQLYVLSGGSSVVIINPAGGKVQTVAEGFTNATALAVSTNGTVYVGLGEPENCVRVFEAGRLVKTIGRPGGRALVGAWQPDGLRFIRSLALAADGKLWAAEGDNFPKRFSSWDSVSGALVKEFFGPTTYGALGGAISPLDPNVMVGLGCEWLLDPQTGLSTCVGTITREGMENSRFGVGSNGRLYLAVAPKWSPGPDFIDIFERLGPADYKLRARFSYEGKIQARKRKGETVAPPRTMYWADENGDGQQQTNEVTTVEGHFKFSSWYMALMQDLTIHSQTNRFRVKGFTACGAPQYDLTKPELMPQPAGTSGLGSLDGRKIVCNGKYNTDCSWYTAYDIASGKLLWTYPDNFVGVHGSHKACPPEQGMIRGAYDIVGSAKLPKPVGNIWVIPTNIGEWHVLTEDGFYLTRLFEPDPMKFKWPEKAVPGVSLDSVPCGMGGEDFGGSICQTKDGKLYLQAGKTGFWNVEVNGLDTVASLKGGEVVITEAEAKLAQGYRERSLQAAVGGRRLAIPRLTPVFTGKPDIDFKGVPVISYQKQESAAVRSSATWDDQFMYLVWDVKDNTPWVNGATDVAEMYVSGDTVDFQLGTDPKADKKRKEAIEGDLRLSIGNLQGKPTAVLYRKISAVKKPKVFSSGVIKAYEMDYVSAVAEARIEVKVNPGKGYTVEAAIPLAVLGLKPAAGLSLRGDLGVTHGDPSENRTRLRTYWSNQQTGIVDDAVFELQLEPKNWGEFVFE